MSVISGPAKVVVTSSRHQIVCGLTQRAMLAGRLDLFPCLLREDFGPPAITEQKPHGNCAGDSVNTMDAAFSDSVSRHTRMGQQVLLPSGSHQRRDPWISMSRNLSRNCTRTFLASLAGKNRRRIRNLDHPPAQDREAAASLLFATAARNLNADPFPILLFSNIAGRTGLGHFLLSFAICLRTLGFDQGVRHVKVANVLVVAKLFGTVWHHNVMMQDSLDLKTHPC